MGGAATPPGWLRVDKDRKPLDERFSGGKRSLPIHRRAEIAGGAGRTRRRYRRSSRSRVRRRSRRAWEFDEGGGLWDHLRATKSSLGTHRRRSSHHDGSRHGRRFGSHLHQHETSATRETWRSIGGQPNLPLASRFVVPRTKKQKEGALHRARPPGLSSHHRTIRGPPPEACAHVWPRPRGDWFAKAFERGIGRSSSLFAKVAAASTFSDDAVAERFRLRSSTSEGLPDAFTVSMGARLELTPRIGRREAKADLGVTDFVGPAPLRSPQRAMPALPPRGAPRNELSRTCHGRVARRAPLGPNATRSFSLRVWT